MKSSLATGRSGSRMNRTTRSVSIVIPTELEESVSEPSQEDYDIHITRIGMCHLETDSLYYRVHKVQVLLIILSV